MSDRIKVETTYTPDGAPRFKVRIVAPRTSDFTCSRSRRHQKPDRKPKPYLKVLRVDFASYLKVTAEQVPIDSGTGLIFLVTTGGGRCGAS